MNELSSKQPRPSEQTDLSNSIYSEANDLSGYQYPDFSLVSEEFQSTLIGSVVRRDACCLPILLGDNSNLQIEDLFNRPNLLIAGTTGSGKTQFLYNQIAFWLYYKHPSQLKFVFCGSKSIDYTLFGKLEKHFLAIVDKGSGIVTPENFLQTAIGLIFEIQHRIHLFTLAGVKTIKQYNALILKRQLDYNQGHRFLPDVAVLIDDLYDFSYSEELDSLLIQITQKNSHTGIYILAATSQVNSPNISRQLRSNFVLRAAFRLVSQSDSKKVLDKPGAEKLMRPGQLIYNFNGQLIKAQQPYIEYERLHTIMEGIAGQKGYSDSYRLYNPNPEPEIDLDVLDPLIDDAARLIVMYQQASTSLIQRKLKLGYNRAGRMIDQLEAIGVVGPFEGSKAREVLIPDDYALERFLNELHSSESGYNPGSNHAFAQQGIIPNPPSQKSISRIPAVQAQEYPPALQSTPKVGLWDKLKKLF